MLRSLVFLATLLIASTAVAGDGTFGVPPSGILPAPTRTAALSDDDLRSSRTPNATASVVQLPPAEREPAANAGRSRPVSVEPDEPVRPKKKHRKPQAKKPVPTVDPSYLARMQAEAPPRAPQQLYPPVSAPAQSQAALPAYQRRGLFTSGALQRAAPSVQTYAQPKPQQAQQSSGRAKVSRSGVPCHELRGIFTSPPECG